LNRRFAPSLHKIKTNHHASLDGNYIVWLNVP
jgi:hypothetical protein